MSATVLPDLDPLAARVVLGLVKVSLALKTKAWQQAGERGLTPTQGQMLALLRGRPRGTSRLSDLAAGLGVTAATASDALRSLADKGLAQKGRSGEDARSLAVTLTAKGRAEAHRAAAWPDFLIPAVGTLTAEEQATFLCLIVKMIRALQERRQIPVSRMCITCRFFRPHVHADEERPHHCDFVDAAFGDGNFRLECPEHEPATAQAAERAWRVFLRREAAQTGEP